MAESHSLLVSSRLPPFSSSSLSSSTRCDPLSSPPSPWPSAPSPRSIMWFVESLFFTRYSPRLLLPPARLSLVWSTAQPPPFSQFRLLTISLFLRSPSERMNSQAVPVWDSRPAESSSLRLAMFSYSRCSEALTKFDVSLSPRLKPVQRAESLQDYNG